MCRGTPRVSRYPETETPREALTAALEALSGVYEEVFASDADPEELRAFYEAIGLRMEYDYNSKTMRVEIAVKTSTPTSAKKVGVTLGVRGGT
jgi:hypothetical protein